LAQSKTSHVIQLIIQAFLLWTSPLVAKNHFCHLAQFTHQPQQQHLLTTTTGKLVTVALDS